MNKIDFYYDFRSPFAYFAFHRRHLFLDKGAEINWKPVLVSALINLQVDRQPLDVVIDPMSPAKRSHFMSDIFRLIAHWEIPFAPPQPTPPVCNKAMAMAAILAAEGKDQFEFIERVFRAVWQEQEDAESTRFLEACQKESLKDVSLSDMDIEKGMRILIENTENAYKLSVFGTPTFIHNEQLYFGADRMELLASTL
ncbi:MAG: DsbA family protein [Pseudomonadales bacterium]|nr:DsbA family protein [Pseudomonadales bacterium]